MGEFTAIFEPESRAAEAKGAALDSKVVMGLESLYALQAIIASQHGVLTQCLLKWRTLLMHTPDSSEILQPPIIRKAPLISVANFLSLAHQHCCHPLRHAAVQVL